MKKFTLLVSAISFLFGSIANAQSNQLLGMTANGGAHNGGTIFKINYNGTGFKVLYSFSNATGRNPYGTLIQANNGLFYGTADSGGANKGGVIFSFDTSNNQYAVVYSFSKKDKNGYYPGGSLFQASNGLLYGMTGYGGTNDLGVLFSFDTATNAYKKLVDFFGATGAHPYHNSLMQASNGLLYGMTYYGGYRDDGVLFSFNLINNTLNAYDADTHEVGDYMAHPGTRLIEAKDGQLYGALKQSNNFCGDPPLAGALISFNLTSNALQSRYRFRGPCDPNLPDGAYPYGSLIEKSAGVFYGLNSGDAAYSLPANIFKFQSDVVVATEVFDFGINDGSLPYGSLLAANDGNLYGMTWAGGASNFGTIFRFNPADNSFLKLHDFDGTHGANPYADLITCLLPMQPGDISGPAAACFGSTVTYSINPIAGATSYKWTVPSGSVIQGAKNGTSIKVVFGSTGGAITVKAKNSCGFSPVRSKSILLHSCIVSNNKIAIEFNESLSPNPTKGSVTLRFNSSTTDNFSIKVTDMVGKLIMNIKGKAQTGLNTINFDISNFAKGIYIVQLSEGNNKGLIKKIILQ